MYKSKQLYQTTYLPLNNVASSRFGTITKLVKQHNKKASYDPINFNNL